MSAPVRININVELDVIVNTTMDILTKSRNGGTYTCTG